jgi:uncharacterized membrane protein (UPF0136 family)
MNTTQIQLQENVFKRILWLYGLYTLLSNVFFLAGYYLLPEGFMRGTYLGAIAEFVAQPETFWAEFGRTLVTNVGIVTVLCIVLNLMTVRGFSLGYFLPISLGIVSGLVLGTNSFIADDLSHYGVREGMVLGLTIGGVEMLGYILVIAATVNFEIYRYESWWRWNQKTIWVKRLNEIRLSKSEILCLVVGIFLVLIGAYRETAMAMNL